MGPWSGCCPWSGCWPWFWPPLALGVVRRGRSVGCAHVAKSSIQASISPRMSAFRESGAYDARTDIAASAARVGVVEVVGGAHRGVLAEQPRTEQQRVVGPERDGGTRVEQRRDRHGARGRCRCRARRSRSGRPPARCRSGRSARAAQGPRRSGPRARAGRRRGARPPPHAGRAQQLASVRHEAQACPARDGEGRGEVAGACLVARRWTGRTPRHPRRRTAPRAGPACARRAGAGCGWRRSTSAIPRPVRVARVRDRVEHQLGERGDPAEPRGVAAGVDLDLQPPAAVGGVVLGRLPHQAADVRPRCAARSGRRRRAAGSGTSPSRRPRRAVAASPRRGRRGGRPVALGELDKRPVPHRPREVQVQMRLRQRAEVAARHGVVGAVALGGPTIRDRAQANSFCSRVTPSTRSSSPRAYDIRT